MFRSKELSSCSWERAYAGSCQDQGEHSQEMLQQQISRGAMMPMMLEILTLASRVHHESPGIVQLNFHPHPNGGGGYYLINRMGED
ncbi:MAG: hypothetical protein C0514_08425 [Candidatus Puniceispirillum sp.]|nr:hypothetical protein [Candidatus Puniceispirillum sp.]